MGKLVSVVRDWFRSVRNRFWLWLFKLSSSRVSEADRIAVLDKTWFRLVRFRLGEIRRSDLGEAFAHLILQDVNEGDLLTDAFGRDYRDEIRDVRVDRVSG